MEEQASPLTLPKSVLLSQRNALSLKEVFQIQGVNGTLGQVESWPSGRQEAQTREGDLGATLSWLCVGGFRLAMVARLRWTVWTLRWVMVLDRQGWGQARPGMQRLRSLGRKEEKEGSRQEPLFHIGPC